MSFPPWFFIIYLNAFLCHILHEMWHYLISSHYWFVLNIFKIILVLCIFVIHLNWMIFWFQMQWNIVIHVKWIPVHMVYVTYSKVHSCLIYLWQYSRETNDCFFIYFARDASLETIKNKLRLNICFKIYSKHDYWYYYHQDSIKTHLSLCYLSHDSFKTLSNAFLRHYSRLDLAETKSCCIIVHDSRETM